MQTLSNVLKWILVSSADPDRWSTTVKMALLGLIPFIMQGIGITCGLHLVCPIVNVDELTGAFLSIANLVFYALSAVSIVGSVFAFMRKIVRTLTGTNAAFPQNQ